MAKLEQQMTPDELLDTIRTGVVKQDLVKQYKTSEKELAMMLLPLYRGGIMTKEEFNDFFKGVPVRSVPSKDTGRESSMIREAAGIPPSEAPADEEPDAAPSDEQIPGLQPGDDISLIDSLEDSDQLSASDAKGALAGIEALFETILGKLDSIDGRLSEIEKKLGAL